MKRTLVATLALALSMAAGAWAAPPKGLMGAGIGGEGFQAADGTLDRGMFGALTQATGRPVRKGVGRYREVLGAVGRSRTRGQGFSQFQAPASPAAVLVVTGGGLAAGALVAADGRIVTALAAIGQAAEVGVIFRPRPGKPDLRRAQVVARDEAAGLALLAVAEVPPGATPLALGGGAQTLILASPGGGSLSLTVPPAAASALLASPRALDALPPIPGGCAPKPVSRKASADPKGQAYGVDADCDGKPDYVLLAPDEETGAYLMLFASTPGGPVDLILVDEDRDLKPETAWYDTDGDGQSDLVGHYRKGEAEPSRFERVEAAP